MHTEEDTDLLSATVKTWPARVAVTENLCNRTVCALHSATLVCVCVCVCACACEHTHMCMCLSVYTIADNSFRGQRYEYQ